MESCRLFFVLVGPHARLNDLPSIWNCERGRTLLFISWTRWLFRMLLYLAGSRVYRIFPVLSWKKRWPCSSSDHSAGVAQSSIKDQFFPSFFIDFSSICPVQTLKIIRTIKERGLGVNWLSYWLQQFARNLARIMPLSTDGADDEATKAAEMNALAV